MTTGKPTPFPIVEVDPHDAQDTEPLGAKRKFWFRREPDGLEWLFKADERIAGGQETVGIGEDWSEKLSCEICGLLGIPHVPYELAVEVRTRVPGVICPNIAEEPVVLVLGNQLMLERDPAYPRDANRKYGVRQHSIDAVIETVERLEPPHSRFGDLPDGVQTAIDVFVAYVMLDALIANQDRHHQNWAALREQDESRLAPTFDHGAALARNEPDEKRSQRLQTNDGQYGVEAFAGKARSSFYVGDGERPVTTWEAFQRFAKRRPTAAKAWLDCLQNVTPSQFASLIDRVPEQRMSKVARDFTAELLRVNRKRLLAGEK